MPDAAKVLVVDDEPHVRAYVSMLLQSTFEDIEVFQAEDDTRALELFASARPDLVLLDINLIGATGLDVLQRILALDARATVIMLTAVNTRRVVEEAQQKGAAGYILKDAEQEELSAAIVEIVRAKFGSATPPASP